jgi:hypothetical protein
LHALEQLSPREDSWLRHASDRRSLVERHIRTEDETEFPKLRQTLDGRRQHRLAGQIRREESSLLSRDETPLTKVVSRAVSCQWLRRASKSNLRWLQVSKPLLV